MMSRSSPSILTSVPDHLPNSTRVAGLDVERDDLAALVAGAGADGDDLALHRLFLGGVGNDDAAGGLGVFLEPLTTTRSCKGRNFIEILKSLILGRGAESGR